MVYSVDIGFEAKSFEGALSEVQFAYENVPFYKEHIDAAGIRLHDITTAEDFRQIPCTTKADYRRNFPLGVLARGKTLAEPLTLISQSSGTGGERLTTIAHTYSLADRMWATLAGNEALSQALARCKMNRPVRYAAPNCSDVECATPGSTMADRTLPDGTLVLPVAHDVLATPEALVKQAVSEIGLFGPQWFYADATHLAFLVRRMKERGEPPPSVSAIALTYTLVTRVARRQLQEYFGADTPSAEIVSMTELGWVAIECPAGRMHINNVKFFPEFLVGSRPARTGERAELVVTSIGDRLSPHLRYRTGDIYTVDVRRCACGSTLPLARHEGRFQTMVRVVKGGQRTLISPRDVDDAVGPDPNIAIYQLHQRRGGELEFRYISSTGSTVNETSLRDRLTHLLGTEAPLVIESVTYIPAARSGKFASCTSALSEESPHAF
ncbi:phenylacetate--CoA ligase family protein [Burkholderia sp. MBR-1]|uniref:phenylacetate--CoA ligase family protein n=1 Tax=Burkholderia sp. MBR-1 TaxID=2732364 RepID=UPI0015EECF80|nr:phenylacetate--CoA ligase family protein [Burkholderia sp. MBR-1]QMI44688.1 phenylacetate--CoA ligase family protein [Burkholderia sp. MBR-1]